MATKKKLTKKRILKGGNPVRESPWMYRVPADSIELKDKIQQKMNLRGCSRSQVITDALNHYLD